MSAFVVSDAHINSLVSYASMCRVSYYFRGGYKMIPGNEQAVAQMLLDANVASVNARYKEQGSQQIRFKMLMPGLNMSAVQAIKACNCFDYQACEIDSYEDSEAAACIRAIVAYACRKVPGYDDAAWEIKDEASVYAF